MKILSIKTLALVTFFFLYGCEFTPQEMYLYREAEFVQIENSKSLIAKDSIVKDKKLVTFIINNASVNNGENFQSLTIDCSKNSVRINQVFKKDGWKKEANPQWNKIYDSAVKNYVCQ